MQNKGEKQTGILTGTTRRPTTTDKNNPRTLSSKNKDSKGQSTTSTETKKQDLEVVFTNGYSLSIIMKDETLLKIFLILCSFSNAVVGSNLTMT